MSGAWNERIAAIWTDGTFSDEEVLARIDALAPERPDGDARALFDPGAP